MPAPRFSIVIPALEEESRIADTIGAARTAYGDDCEILVVDGGSADRTREVAARLARVIVKTGGRGAQLNAGAEHAAGDVFVFLHADTRVETCSGREIAAALSSSGVAGGCHRFRVQPPAGRFTRYALLEVGVNLRTRVFRTATGDQAIFARRESFWAAGGFPDYPLFEDVTLVRRLRGIGRFATVDASARTSRRRWEETGFWRTVAFHWILRTAFQLGVRPELLAAWYDRGSGMRRVSTTDRDERERSR